MIDEACKCGHPKFQHNDGGHGDCKVDHYSYDSVGLLTAVYPCLCDRFRRVEVTP